MRIDLFEKFIKPFDDDSKKAEKRIGSLALKKVKTILHPNAGKTPYKFVNDAAQTIYQWFIGGFMSIRTDERDEVAEAIEIFKKIGTSYHKPVKGKVYRVAHIRVPSSYKEEDILKIDKCKSGPKTLQSWSSTKKGAEWFYNHFVDQQNHDAIPHPERSWVLLETEAHNLDQLLTFESCIQFLYDVCMVLDNGTYQSKWAEKIEYLADHFNVLEMKKLNELICATPEEIPVKVISVYVAPGEKPKKTEQEYMNTRFEEFIKDLLGNFQQEKN